MGFLSKFLQKKSSKINNTKKNVPHRISKMFVDFLLDPPCIKRKGKAREGKLHQRSS